MVVIGKHNKANGVIAEKSHIYNVTPTHVRIYTHKYTYMYIYVHTYTHFTLTSTVKPVSKTTSALL